MKKIIITSVIATSLLLASCSNPFSSTGNASNKAGTNFARGGNIDTSDIVRLKSRKGGPRGEMMGSGARMGSGNFERFGSGSRMPEGERFGSGARVGSGSFMNRFSVLSEEDKTLMQQSMEARRSGNTAKANEIMNTLKAKYPDVFSGSMMPNTRPNRGGEMQPPVQ